MENNVIPDLPYKRLPGTRAYAKLWGRKNKTFVKEDPKELSSGKLWAWLTVDKFLWTTVNHVTSRTNVASTSIEPNVVKN